MPRLETGPRPRDDLDPAAIAAAIAIAEELKFMCYYIKDNPPAGTTAAEAEEIARRTREASIDYIERNPFLLEESPDQFTMRF